MTSHEHRKDVWRAVRQSPHAINLTDQDVKIPRQGLVVYEDRRAYYDDGRAKAEFVKQVDGRQVLFIPFTPQADEQPAAVRRC